VSGPSRTSITLPALVIAIWMVVYLGISLVTSLGMNIYNARTALIER